MKEYILTLNKREIEKYRDGYPLIRSDALTRFDSDMEEGSIVRLVDGSGIFTARGYIGRQNKGIGWVLSGKEKESIDGAFFFKRLAAALGKRSRFFADEETTAFRVFNGEGDGIGGLTIDFYAGYYLINWYSRGIYRFREEILGSLSTMTAAKGIYEKKRFDDGGKYIEDDDFVWGQRAEFPLIVKENGVRYAVYLNEGAMTGIFLDQREVRARLRKVYAKGKTILNTFSYTGAFSVAAALGGAKKTVGVDLANRSLDRTAEQFEINGLDPKSHEIIVEDVFKFFKSAVKQGRTYDVVILDPPSFARSKNHVFSAPKDYGDLIAQAVSLLEDKGVLLASTNCAAFDMKRFREMVREGFGQTGAGFSILESYGLPEDFRVLDCYGESDYLKVMFIQVHKK